MSDSNILLVDDDSAFTRAVTALLESRGFEVTTAALGEQAIAMIGIRAFDAAIVDVRLPDLDGTQVTRRLSSARANMPILMISGDGTEENRRQCLASGARRFLAKPIEPIRLIHALDELLPPLTSDTDASPGVGPPPAD